MQVAVPKYVPKTKINWAFGGAGGGAGVRPGAALR